MIIRNMKRRAAVVGLLWIAVTGVRTWAEAPVPDAGSPVPSSTLVEAEAAPRGAVKTDPAASGGKYVSVAGDYQPLVTAPVPAGTADAAFTIWIRRRGLSSQLKGTPGGSQKELRWLFDKPARFEWASFGRFRRSELGDTVVIIRGPGKDADEASAGVDAVLFAAHSGFDPNKPPRNTAPVAVRVDWSKPLGATTARSFAINLFNGFNPEQTQGRAYKDNLAYLGVGLVRFHHAGVMGDSRTKDGLIDEANRRWDADKVKRALGVRFGTNPARLVNISGWPAWMDTDKDGRLDADQSDRYAALLADLVRLVNKDAKLGVRYWEVTNEKDDAYFTTFHTNGGWGPLKDPARPDRVEDLAAIFNKCAVAMKRVDPTIRVGGPAAARPDLIPFHTRFVKGTLPNLDFFSFHAYASGSADTSDQEVYDRAAGIGKYTGAIVEMLKRESPNRRVPVMLGEYNVSWTWETRDPRMTNHKGGVFDALTMVAAASAGADSTQAWNEKDGIYGKTDPRDGRRPGAHVFHLFNTFFVGSRVASASGDDRRVVAFAVASPAQRRRALLLINRTDDPQAVRCEHADWKPAAGATAQKHEVSENGYRTTALKAGEATGKPLIVPPHSVTTLVFGG